MTLGIKRIKLTIMPQFLVMVLTLFSQLEKSGLKQVKFVVVLIIYNLNWKFENS